VCVVSFSLPRTVANAAAQERRHRSGAQLAPRVLAGAERPVPVRRRRRRAAPEVRAKIDFVYDCFGNCTAVERPVPAGLTSSGLRLVGSAQ
jgi:hypothetical protein